MNLLYLADAFYDDLPGGSRTLAHETAIRLVTRGHRVTFLVGRQVAGTPAEERVEGLRLVRYNGAGRRDAFVRAGESACRSLLAAGERFDVVHTHFAYAAVGPLRALEGVPAIRTFHGPWHDEGLVEDRARLAAASAPRRIGLTARAKLRWLAKRRVEQENLKRAARVVVLSELMRCAAIASGADPQKILQIPGGVDLTRFHPKDRTLARIRLGLPAERRILLSVRRLAPRMGLENLVEAMKDVVSVYPEALLLIGGKGPLQAQLEAQIVSLGLSEQVRLVGFIPDAALADYYCSADLFVLPTVALEGFGLVTVEALACGTPVLGTPVGATPEILNALDPRLLFPGWEAPALSAGIRRFFAEERSEGWAPQRLRRFVEERYTWDRHVEALEELYQAILKEE